MDLDASVGSVLLGASPLQSVRWLHIASHSFSPWQSGFSEMDVQEELEEEPVNLLGEMKLKRQGQTLHHIAKWPDALGKVPTE